MNPVTGLSVSERLKRAAIVIYESQHSCLILHLLCLDEVYNGTPAQKSEVKSIMHELLTSL